MRIEQTHTNITFISRNGAVLFEKEAVSQEALTDKSLLNLNDIITFAEEVDLDLVKDCLERQIEYEHGHL